MASRNLNILVHLEPMWFRNDARFLSVHFEPLVGPILSALTLGQNHVNLTVSSNSALCDVSNCLAKFIFSSGHQLKTLDWCLKALLESYQYSKKQYCLDIFSRKYDFESAYLLDAFNETLKKSSPDIVVTTSKNRYLEYCCEQQNIPLICTEMGPLPRISYPDCRQLSIGSHLSASIVEDRDASSDDYIKKKILKNQNLEISRHYKNQRVCDFINSIGRSNALALLPLQPSDWVTWDGALSDSFQPPEIIIKALNAMRSERLIVVFHPVSSGLINQNIIDTLKKSDERLIIAPDDISQGCSELYVPHVDEIVTVSSNVGFLAPIYEKSLTLLGQSFLNDFICENYKLKMNDHQIKQINNIYYNYHVDQAQFTDILKLRDVIYARLLNKGYADVADRFQKIELSTH